VENACAYIKQWRGIATRYARRLASFAAAVNFCCLFPWLDVLSLAPSCGVCFVARLANSYGLLAALRFAHPSS